MVVISTFRLESAVGLLPDFRWKRVEMQEVVLKEIACVCLILLPHISHIVVGGKA